MRLPGTRYQEHGWEQVRKLLGSCSAQTFRQIDGAVLEAGLRQPAALLDPYVETLAALLHGAGRRARSEAPGNSYGDSVGELALSLLFELQAQPAFWDGLCAAVAGEQQRCGAFWNEAAGEAMLRKKFNDMYAGLRDKVDADHYTAATGRPCSPNRIYTYRMLDTAYREIERLFAGWRQYGEQVGAILDRPLDGIPIEVRQLAAIGDCKADWIIRWSATRERFDGSPGPLHTRSKRFASLKNSPEKIADMLAEIGDYEELSSNRDSATSWQGDADASALWLEDYWRVLEEAEAGAAAHDVQEPDRILAAPDGEEDEPDYEPEPQIEAAAPPAQLAREQQLASALSLPPRYLELARAAQDGASWSMAALREATLPVRLAVCQKLLGVCDDSYPEDWLDPATGALPTLQQLAALDRISMPTLRKRRNEAIAQLYQQRNEQLDAAARPATAPPRRTI